MSKAPRFRRTPPVTQYGSADLKNMTAEEISAAAEAGHFHELEDGRDPDASVDHKAGCSKPPVERVMVDNRSVRQSDPVRFRCPECIVTKEI
ncbi:hypothetical protein F9278_23180 [Streptomyces phaeolivaceus]|uniref:Uncharacterized protein n=1 Tax=Streptomyces phaeolivaceus TaxID=2653200 RepID=A0A5P8K5I7_9ACTN|nr:hypothetical protein [Streptomyces phaeolivaceus]QFQ98583.1 hypothetical protein F9278_23180 [Streptomyces phaeolivaceus]